jgi:four helix bundle protein
MIHQDLQVWKNSIDLVVKIYSITESFPRHEIYGLSAHIRKSAISIPSNISEGAARDHTKEYIQFLYISLGSLSELETQVIISRRLEYIGVELFKTIEQRIKEIRIQLASLIRSLKNKLRKSDAK